MAQKGRYMLKRKLFLFMLAGIMSLSVYAGDDDVMITRDGNCTPVKILKMSSSEVTFIDLKRKKSGEQTVPANFVYMIKKEKGNDIFFDEDGNQSTAPAAKLDHKANIIYTNDGHVYQAYDMQVSKDQVSYKQKKGKNSPVQTLDKNTIFMVQNEDGTNTLYNENYAKRQQAARQSQYAPSPSAQNAIQTAVPPMAATPNGDVAAGMQQNVSTVAPQQQPSNVQTLPQGGVPAMNQTLIDAYNNVPLGWAKAPKASKASAMLCRLMIQDGSVLDNNDVTLTFGTASSYNGTLTPAKDIGKSSVDVYNWSFLVTVKNKTTKTIYLDLGNTFFMRNGEAQAYFIPSSTAGYEGSSSGGSVNLGAITGSSILGGLTVGGGSSSGSSTVTFAQRVVAVPPMSTKTLAPQLFFLPNVTISPFVRVDTRYLKSLGSKGAMNISDLTVGDVIRWNAGQSLLNYSFFLTYSNTENCENTQTMKSDFFMAEMYAMPYSKISSMVKVDDFSGNYGNALIFLLKNSKAEGGNPVEKSQLGGF